MADATPPEERTAVFSAAAFSAAASCTIHGLVAKPELNGTTGTVISFDATTGRYGIKCGSDGKELAIKAVNLQLEHFGKDDLGVYIPSRAAQIVHPKLSHLVPVDLWRRWREEFNAHGSHIWGLASLGAMLQNVATLRGDATILEGVEMTPLGLQALYERTWAAGFDGGSEYFHGKMVGKAGRAAETGPADFFDVLAFLGVDTWQLQVIPPANEILLNSASGGDGHWDVAAKASRPEFHGARCATLAAIIAAAQCGDGLPLLMQSAGGAPLKWLSGFALDVHGPLALELPEAPLARQIWRDLPALLANAQGPPFELLLVRAAPMHPKRRDALRGQSGMLANVLIWSEEESKWRPPTTDFGEHPHSNGRGKGAGPFFSRRLIELIRANTRTIATYRGLWGRRAWQEAEPVASPGAGLPTPTPTEPKAGGAAAPAPPAPPAPPPAPPPSSSSSSSSFAWSAIAEGTMGYWPHPSDVQQLSSPSPTASLIPAGPALANAHVTTPPSTWPACFREDATFKRLMGKHCLQGKRCRAVGPPTTRQLLEGISPPPEVHISPHDSFANAEALAAARGWAVVRGFALMEAVDEASGARCYVAHKRWWNIRGGKEGGAWIDLTPRLEEGLTLILLESEVRVRPIRLTPLLLPWPCPPRAPDPAPSH